MKLHARLVFFLCLFSHALFAQEKPNPEVDSIKARIAVLGEDTTRLASMHDLYMAYSRFDNELAMETAEEMLALSQKLSDTTWIVVAYDNIARTYWMSEDHPNALRVLHLKLAVCEKTGNMRDVANCYNNIGAVYRGTKNLDKALEYFMKSHAIREQLNDTMGMGSSYANIGLVYDQKGDMRKGLYYYGKSKAIRLKKKDNAGLSILYVNIGGAYIKLGVFDSARVALDSALILERMMGDLRGMATCFQNIGTVYHRLGQYDKAKAYEDSAIVFGRRSGKLEVVINAYGELSEIEEEQGNYRQALYWNRLRSGLNDSIFNDNMTASVAEMEAKYNSEKQKRENDKLKAGATRDAMVKKFLYGLAGLGLVLAGALSYAYRNKRRSNILLARQNLQIETQKQEITDSITYARRIQQAILPPAGSLQEYFPESFTLYQPKAIVSGDFWWMKRRELGASETRTPGSLLLAVADCTGHGVPGAFMSLLCADLLSSVSEKENDPGQLLTSLNRALKSMLHHEGGGLSSVQDGMDIALVKVDGHTLHFAGANRPLWIFSRDGRCNEVKPTKAAIGGHTPESQVFTTQEVALEPGDTVYLFSDGFADQFGGDDGKKLMTRRLRTWMSELYSLPAAQQHNELQKRFEAWRGKNEQIDDILVLGFRVE